MDFSTAPRNWEKIGTDNKTLVLTVFNHLEQKIRDS